MNIKKILKKEVENSLRIASYNILHGGEKRLNDISKIIKKIDPDVCGILEAVGWQNQDILKKFANKLGYNFFYIGVANSKYNIVVISKIPLKIKIIKNGIKHVALETSIEKGEFKNLKIFFVHFSPISEDARLLELTKLTKYIKKSKNIIMMGDFNSLSEQDPYNKKSLLSILQKNKLTKFGTDNLRFDVIKKIKSINLIDTMEYLKLNSISSTPTLSNKDYNHATNLRLDYAFLTKNLIEYLTKAEIFKNKITEIASDHYPIFIELNK